MGIQDIQVPSLITPVECVKYGSMKQYNCFSLHSVITAAHFSEDQRKKMEGDIKMIHLVPADVSPRRRQRQNRIIAKFCCAILNLKLM